MHHVADHARSIVLRDRSGMLLSTPGRGHMRGHPEIVAPWRTAVSSLAADAPVEIKRDDLKIKPGGSRGNRVCFLVTCN